MADAPELTPIAPEEGGSIPPKTTPFAAEQIAAVPPAAAPAAPTIRLKKPLIRRPTIHKPVVGGARPPVAPAAAPAPAAPKSSTQSLKSVTGPIPAQAVLRKTGIVAEGIITPAQQQAAKSKTSRISLESAIGVAPVKEAAAAPIKTIKLRRPGDLNRPQPFKPVAPAEPPAAAEPPPVAPLADVPPPVAPVEAAAPESATTTQKRTLKLHRPTMGVKPPAMGPAAAAPDAGGDVADIADVPDIPGMPGDSLSAPSAAMSAGVPSWFAALSLVASIAVLLALGGLLYFVWSDGNAPEGADTDPNSPYVISM